MPKEYCWSPPQNLISLIVSPLDHPGNGSDMDLARGGRHARKRQSCHRRIEFLQLEPCNRGQCREYYREQFSHNRRGAYRTVSHHWFRCSLRGHKPREPGHPASAYSTTCSTRSSLHASYTTNFSTRTLANRSRNCASPSPGRTFLHGGNWLRVTKLLRLWNGAGRVDRDCIAWCRLRNRNNCRTPGVSSEITEECSKQIFRQPGSG